MDMQILFLILLAAIAVIILVKRFSGGRYGTLRPSMETTNAYLSARVEPGMKYYLTGSDLYPAAIIGIVKAWTLESDLWKPLDLDPERLRELIFNIKSQGIGTGVLPYGHEIYDDREEKIGNWFSLPGQNTYGLDQGRKARADLDAASPLHAELTSIPEITRPCLSRPAGCRFPPQMLHQEPVHRLLRKVVIQKLPQDIHGDLDPGRTPVTARGSEYAE